jgi:hypothetical protein
LRKSERIRILELEMVRLNFELEYLKSMLSALLDSDLKSTEMDAGKWYMKKQNPDIPNN